LLCMDTPFDQTEDVDLNTTHALLVEDVGNGVKMRVWDVVRTVRETRTRGMSAVVS
jgi:hypothetical protein